MALSELQRIGLTNGEIRVYEALLELGECTKTKLAKSSGIAPSNVYDVTNRLLEKGIISKVEKNGVAHFSPASPNRLLNFLEDKKKEIDFEVDIVQDLLPSLLEQYNDSHIPLNVEMFMGWKGIQTVFEDLINDCVGNCLVFGASKGESDKKADNFFVKYSKLRAEKGIKTKIIFNEKLRERKERISFFENSSAYNIKFLNQSTPAEILVYDNVSCIIILTKDPLVIRISSKEVAESFKQYFDVMWKEAKD